MSLFSTNIKKEKNKVQDFMYQDRTKILWPSQALNIRFKFTPSEDHAVLREQTELQLRLYRPQLACKMLK